MTTFEYANKVLTGSPLDNFEKMKIMLEHEYFRLTKNFHSIEKETKEYYFVKLKREKIESLLREISNLITFYECVK